MIHNLRFSVCLLYPCKQRGGGYMSVHPSVLLSVCRTYFLGKFYRSRRYVSQTKFFRNLLILTKKNKRDSYKYLLNVKNWGIQFCSNLYTVHFFRSLKFMWYTICNMEYCIGFWYMEIKIKPLNTWTLPKSWKSYDIRLSIKFDKLW